MYKSYKIIQRFEPNKKTPEIIIPQKKASHPPGVARQRDAFFCPFKNKRGRQLCPDVFGMMRAGGDRQADFLKRTGHNGIYTNSIYCKQNYGYHSGLCTMNKGRRNFSAAFKMQNEIRKRGTVTITAKVCRRKAGSLGKICLIRLCTQGGLSKPLHKMRNGRPQVTARF